MKLLKSQDAVTELPYSQNRNYSLDIGFFSTKIEKPSGFTGSSFNGGSSNEYKHKNSSLSTVHEDEDEDEGCQSAAGVNGGQHTLQPTKKPEPFAEIEDFDDTIVHELSRLLPQMSLKIQSESFKLTFKKRDRKNIGSVLIAAGLSVKISVSGNTSAKKSKWVSVTLTEDQASQLVASLSETAQSDGGRKAPGASW